MKKIYTGLIAEKINFGAYDMATIGSLPGNCIQIVANVVNPGDNKCQNPTSTTSYMYIMDHPTNYPN